MSPSDLDNRQVVGRHPPLGGSGPAILAYPAQPGYHPQSRQSRALDKDSPPCATTSARRQFLSVALGLLFSIQSCIALPSQEEAIHIVTAEKGPLRQLQRDEAELLFLGRRTTAADGTPVMLIDLPAGPVRDRFYLLLTGKNPQQARAYWSRQVFTGRARPPLEAGSQEQAVEWLLQNPGAIAYLPASKSDAQLRVLMRLQ